MRKRRPPTTSRWSSNSGPDAAFDPGAQRLDPRAVDAEIAPSQARGRAYVDQACLLVEYKLHVVHEAHQPGAIFGVEVIRFLPDDAGTLHGFDRPTHRSHRLHGAALEWNRRDVVLCIGRIGLARDAVRRRLRGCEPARLHAEI